MSLNITAAAEVSRLVFSNSQEAVRDVSVTFFDKRHGLNYGGGARSIAVDITSSNKTKKNQQLHTTTLYYSIVFRDVFRQTKVMTFF